MHQILMRETVEHCFTHPASSPVRVIEGRARLVAQSDRGNGIIGSVWKLATGASAIVPEHDGERLVTLQYAERIA